MQLSLKRMDWEFVSTFRIAYRTRTHAQTVVVALRDGSIVGRGETSGVSYHGETVDTLFGELTRMVDVVGQSLSRANLQHLLPAGGTRNALDCALWDLEAKRSGRRAWELAGLTDVRALTTAYTLGLDTPDAMSRAAAGMPQYSLLKLKLGGEGDIERVAAVRAARPDAELIVDANQSWNERQARAYPSPLAELKVRLIEQPLPAGQDAVLSTFKSAVPFCADESCQTSESLPSLVGKYEFVNIKLDKTGGLTEALRLMTRAKAEGFRLMVGCTAGSSLSMAPAFIVGQYCDIVDLDSPLLLKSDMEDAIRYDGNRMSAPDARLWG
jgi:L-alanine-DL-glutamate epimerase-like enolase superfamily enzyme